MTKLIDNSGGSSAAIADGKRVYNIVSGTIAAGELTSDDDGIKGGYGLVYPDLGIIILNPGRLKEQGVAPGQGGRWNTSTITASNTNNQWNSVIYSYIRSSFI